MSYIFRVDGRIMAEGLWVPDSGSYRPFATSEDVTYYVATDGSDEIGDGSVDKPWATLQHVIDQLPKIINHTVTIQIQDGTYAWTGGVDIVGFSGSGVLIIQGNTADRTAVQIKGNFAAGGTYEGVITVKYVNIGQFVIRYLTIDNDGTNSINGIFVAGCSGLVFIYTCVVQDFSVSGRNGIFINTSPNTVVQSCDLSNNYRGLLVSTTTYCYARDNTSTTTNATYGYYVNQAAELGYSGTTATGSIADTYVETYNGAELRP